MYPFDPFLILMSVELALAPGVTDSALSLSYPYTNELINSLIKALIYICVGGEHAQSFSALGVFRVFDVDIDFHKWLYIVTSLYSVYDPRPDSDGWIWGCRSRFKYYMGTDIRWILLTDFNIG